MFLPTSACENCFITLCSHCRTSALQSLYSPGLTHALRAYMEAHMGLTLPMFVYCLKLNVETDYGYKASLYGRKGRARHSMSPHLMASKRRAVSPIPVISALSTISFPSVSSAFPPIPTTPHVSLSLSSQSLPCYALMYFLCFWPGGTGRRVICLKDRRTAPQQIATNCGTNRRWSAGEGHFITLRSSWA